MGASLRRVAVLATALVAATAVSVETAGAAVPTKQLGCKG
jgi:hypothetical protein